MRKKQSETVARMKKYWKFASLKLPFTPLMEKVGGKVKLMPSSPPVSGFTDTAKK